MPRRADYGDEVADDRQFQDDMNQWREQKSDHSAQDKEYKKQRRELNSKLEQIKNPDEEKPACCLRMIRSADPTFGEALASC